MRIVHIYKDYFPVLGGIENHMRDLAEAQARAGHDVTVLVTQQRGHAPTDINENGVRVVRVPRHFDVQSAPIALSFPKRVAELTAGADIAHLQAPYPVGEACNLVFGRAKRTVISWQSDIVRQKTLLKFYAPILRRVIAKADRIIPSSDAYASTSPWLRDQVRKCTVVPIGIDAGRFARTMQSHHRATRLRNSWLSSLPSSDDALVLLSVGRFRYYKGLDDLIRALTLMRNAVAVLAGNGIMEAEWKALAQRLDVAKRVFFVGSPNDADLPAYYQAADAYVLPANARAEAYGIAVLEAMASGLPVITTEVGTATSWINQDGVTGYVVPPLQPPAIAEAASKLVDRDTRERMGAAARQRVIDEFTREKMVDRIDDVYRSLL